MGEGSGSQAVPSCFHTSCFPSLWKGLVWSHLSRKTLANSNLAFQFLQYFSLLALWRLTH
uniref:Uncharacterized protein n=1 Tax=Anguilla anguilla TaxID=7936 RepID=A0A0E9PPA4_ANGAN